jgi:hypothetical protein
MKLVGKRKRRIAEAIAVAIALVVIHFYGAQLGFIGYTADRYVPGIISSHSYKRAVMFPERNDAYSAYGVLAERRSKVAHQIALQHLNSTDDYLWMNAASYLGAIGEPASVPYLIKALRHSASRADEERSELLYKLTGEDFRTDFAKWQQWWITRHPDFKIDWESDLGPSARLPIEDRIRAIKAARASNDNARTPRAVP